MQTKIRFTKFGCCSAIGNFEPGDTARIHSAMAKHLVEEAGCAVYAEAVVKQEPEPVRSDREVHEPKAKRRPSR